MGGRFRFLMPELTLIAAVDPAHQLLDLLTDTPLFYWVFNEPFCCPGLLSIGHLAARLIRILRSAHIQVVC